MWSYVHFNLTDTRQRYYVHIINNVSFSLELVEESLISDYHDEGPGQGSQSNVETA